MSFPLMPLIAAGTSTAGSAFISSGQNFVVPTGVTSLSVGVSGAGGGGGSGNAGASGGRGGDGALTTQTALSVTPGETLNMSGGLANGGTTLFRRGTTTLVSASGGSNGGNATKAPDEPTYYPGNPGADGASGTGGTVTAGGGASGGAGGGINSAGSPGSNGSVSISWVIP